LSACGVCKVAWPTSQLDAVAACLHGLLRKPAQLLLAGGMSPLSEAPTRVRIVPACRALPRSEVPTQRGSGVLRDVKWDFSQRVPLMSTTISLIFCRDMMALISQRSVVAETSGVAGAPTTRDSQAAKVCVIPGVKWAFSERLP